MCFSNIGATMANVVNDTEPGVYRNRGEMVRLTLDGQVQKHGGLVGDLHPDSVLWCTV